MATGHDTRCNAGEQKKGCCSRTSTAKPSRQEAIGRHAPAPGKVPVLKLIRQRILQMEDCALRGGWARGALPLDRQSHPPCVAWVLRLPRPVSTRSPQQAQTSDLQRTGCLTWPCCMSWVATAPAILQARHTLQPCHPTPAQASWAGEQAEHGRGCTCLLGLGLEGAVSPQRLPRSLHLPGASDVPAHAISYCSCLAAAWLLIMLHVALTCPSLPARLGPAMTLHMAPCAATRCACRGGAARETLHIVP